MATALATKLLAGLIRFWFWLVSKTGKFTLVGGEYIKDRQIAGYWHGDSCPMFLFLKSIRKSGKPICVIVTADWRGNVLEALLKGYSGKAIRVSDGAGTRHSLKTLGDEANAETGILATALDGPLGPNHEPKKLLFHLANKADREMLAIQFTHKRVLRLGWRWDGYVIPLPFSDITARVISLGKVSGDDLRNYKQRYSAALGVAGHGGAVSADGM